MMAMTTPDVKINTPTVKVEDPVNVNIKNAKKRIAVMSGKGGVGKTTISVNLALGLAKKGKRVGLLDADLTGPNVAKMLGLEGQRAMMTEKGILPVEHIPGLQVFSMSFLMESSDSPVIWRGPLKMGAIKQFMSDVLWDEMDYLIVDLPPGTGDEALSVAQLLTEPSAIVVTTPQEVALLDSRKSINFARALKMDLLGVVENMSGMECPHCGESIDLFGVGGGEKAAKEMDVNFLGRVPIDPEMVINGDSGSPAIDNDGSNSQKALNSILDKVIVL
ncbi:MAG: Mrp/NBP35 family ATP-binding protein [Thermoplasmata archaeon]|nr:Mrp/NBP35 family ATP-binding protein [Thermoplasmata archaeon]